MKMIKKLIQYTDTDPNKQRLIDHRNLLILKKNQLSTYRNQIKLRKHKTKNMKNNRLD